MVNTRKLLSVQTAESLDGGSGHAVGKTVGYDGQEKNGKLTTKGFRPIAMLPTMYRLYLKNVATVGGPGNPRQTQPTVWPCPWSSNP